MSSPGRNDPCLCGSGRKFKHCCLAAADTAQTTRRRMREAESRLIPLLWQLVLENWGQEGSDEAYDTFFMDTPCPDDILTHRDHESLYLTWLGLGFEPRGPGGRREVSAAAAVLATVADEADAGGMPEFERRFLAAAEAATPSFHAVVDLAAGEWIDLEDILTGARCRVLETSASRTLRRGEVIYARVVTLDSVSIMVGCGATALPPTRRADLADLRGTLARRGGRLSAADLRTHENMLRRWYLLAADHLHNPPLPRLTNTDGDPVEPTILTFTLTCSPAEAFAALKSLSVTHSDDDLLSDAELDAQGALRAFSIGWSKRGNAKHASWDNTILGHLKVDGQTLTADVNSRKRATRLRRQIEKRLAGRARLDKTEIQSIESLLAQAREKAGAGELPEPEPPPEAAAAVAAMMEAHWERWPDEPVPALKGQTPREAARSSAGRERLEALLAEFELKGGAPVARLRAALGL
jgi:hypothetical protein